MALAIAAAVFGGSGVGAQELLTNGDFEAGSFAGWTVADQPGGEGSFFISTAGAATPVSGFPTLGSPANGSYYAVSDTFGPGAHVLIQSFTIPANPGTVILSFDMFVNDQNGMGPIVDPAGLDYTAVPNQHTRVDILSAAAMPFDTGAGVLQNFYLGVDAGARPHPFTSYQFDITSVVAGGGTFQIRFGEVDNRGQLNAGVDNVSVQFASATPIPTLSEWTLVLLVSLLMLAGIAVLRLRTIS